MNQETCRPSRFVALPFLALAVAWSGCRGVEPAVASLRVGMIVEADAPDPGAAFDAARLKVGEVNAGGGLETGDGPVEVELVVEETSGTPGDAVDAARRLLHQRDVVALIGPNLSRNAISVADAAENARIPMICASPTHPQVTDGKRYVFRVAFVDPVQARALVRFAREDLGARTAAVLYDVADSYNRGIAAFFLESFKAAGGRVVATETYSLGREDFTAELTRIDAAKPDVLFLPNYPHDVVVQTRQALELGLECRFLGGDGWVVRRLRGEPSIEGAYFVQHWIPEDDQASPAAKGFADAYRKAYGVPATSLAAMTYDATGVLLQAAAEASRLDAEAIRERLSQVEGYPGVSGSLTFRGAGGDPSRDILIATVRGGVVSVVRRFPRESE